MYQPDLTAGSSHAALGWREWSTFYNHYIVIGSKITWKISALDVLETLTFASFTNTNDTNITNLVHAIEQVGARTWSLGGETGGNAAISMGQKFSARKWTKTNVMDEDDLVCIYDQQPVSDFYFHLVCQNGHTTAASFVLQVTIEFTAIWREPTTLPIGPPSSDA